MRPGDYALLAAAAMQPDRQDKPDVGREKDAAAAAPKAAPPGDQQKRTAKMAPKGGKGKHPSAPVKKMAPVKPRKAKPRGRKQGGQAKKPQLRTQYTKTIKVTRTHFAELASMGRVPVPFVVDRAGYLAARDLVTAAIRRDAVRKAPIVMIPLAGLRAIQTTVRASRVAEHTSPRAGKDHGRAGYPRDLPVVLKLGSKRWLVDGTHRATIAKLDGSTAISGRLVDLDKLRRKS